MYLTPPGIVTMTSLRVLILDANPDDVQQIHDALHAWNYEVRATVVDTEDAYRRALLEEGPFDLVIADLQITEYSALAALEFPPKQLQVAPFRWVPSGQDDDACLALLRRGASDYLRKDRLVRLGPATERAIEHHKLFLYAKARGHLSDDTESRLQSVLDNLRIYKEQWGING